MRSLALVVGVALALACVSAPAQATVPAEKWLLMNSFPATPVVYGEEAEEVRARFAELLEVAGEEGGEEGGEESGDEEENSADIEGESGEEGEGGEEGESGEEGEESGGQQAAATPPKKPAYDVSKVTYHKARGSVLLPATKVVKNTDADKKIQADAGDAAPGAILAGIAKIHRECPRQSCHANSTCPLRGGVCCSGSSHCCPEGATCLSTNPPTCVHDSDSEPNRCAEEECTNGHHCPHEGVATCCIGGDVCCQKDWKCRATNPPTCEKILSLAERKEHEAMEAKLWAAKKKAIIDAVTDKATQKVADLQKQIDAHKEKLKKGQAELTKNLLKMQTSHNERERLNAKAAVERHQAMVAEDKSKKQAITDTLAESKAQDAADAKARAAETEKRIAAHEKLVGHKDAAEAGRKRTDNRRLEMAAQERKQKEADKKKEAKEKEARAKEIAAKAKAAEQAKKKAERQEQETKAKAAREAAEKAAEKIREVASKKAEKAREAQVKTDQKNKERVEAAKKEADQKAHSSRKATEEKGKEETTKLNSRKTATEVAAKADANRKIIAARNAEGATKRANAPFDLVARGGQLLWHRRHGSGWYRRYNLGNVDYINRVTIVNGRAHRVNLKLIPVSGGRRRVPHRVCSWRTRCVRTHRHRYCRAYRHRGRVCTARRGNRCVAWHGRRCARYRRRTVCSNRCHRYLHRWWGRRHHCWWHRWRIWRWWRRRRICRWRRHLHAAWRTRCSRHCRHVGNHCVAWHGRRCARYVAGNCYRWRAGGRYCAAYGYRNGGCAQHQRYHHCVNTHRWIGGGNVRSHWLSGSGTRTWSTGTLRGMRYLDIFTHGGSMMTVQAFGRRL